MTYRAEPKKSLGQHWLHDDSVLDNIADAAEITAEDTVLEIGPGLGTLTRKLVARAKQVIAVEFDEQLAQQLENEQIAKNLQIVSSDIRKFNFEKMPQGYKVVANIPYYLTSHLVRQLAESKNKPSVTVLLIQKEVAERVCAVPGKMGMLSVVAQWYFDCNLGVEVPARFFTPPPKVDSQVVVMKLREQTASLDEAKFFRVVKAGFSEKRKTLSNSLHGGLGISKSEANDILQAANIDQNRRAQTLSLEEWTALYQSTIEHGSL